MNHMASTRNSSSMEDSTENNMFHPTKVSKLTLLNNLAAWG